MLFKSSLSNANVILPTPVSFCTTVALRASLPYIKHPTLQSSDPLPDLLWVIRIPSVVIMTEVLLNPG